MRKGMKVVLTSILLLALVTPVNIPFASAAPNLTATGSNPGICDQTVGSTTNVSAYRISGGDCVVEFKNAGAPTTWTSPAAMSNIRLLVVAGGGGGGGRHSGGGGGGGVLYLTNVNLNLNTNFPLQVGAGGAGSTGTTGGGGSAGQVSYFNGSSGGGSIVANGGGGGAGGGYSANQLNYGGSSTSSPFPSRGSGGGLNAGGTVATGTPGSVNGIPQSAATSINVSITNVVAVLNAYGKSGSQGKTNYCQGPDGANGWCGGGGGGGLDAATDPIQPTGSNPWRAGKGGDGIAISITEGTVTYAGGGGGGAGSDVSGYASNAACKTASALSGPGGAGGGGAGGQCQDNATSGTANTGGGGGGGGLAYITGQARESGNGGDGGSGIVIIRYTPDSAAPTIKNAASPFSFAENTSISTIAATIEISESSTIALSAAGDYLKFTITVVDTDTARIYFLASPDFESQADLDRNNDYIVHVNLTDLAGNISSPSFTIRVTNVSESSSLGAPSISGTAYKGIAMSLTVTVNTPGKARFFMDGKRIANCLSVSTTGAYPNYTATCNWKPTVTSRHTLSATFTPTDNTFSQSTSPVSTIWIVKRATFRS